MVSKRRLPPANGNGHAPVPLPALRKGDRARRLPNGPYGVVVKTDKTRALMHWGTQAIPVGQEIVEKRFEDWVPKVELEKDTTPVVTDEEIARRLKG
jgi:hypothetical protein